MTTKDPQGGPEDLNDSQRAPNNRKEHTRHTQVSPKGASVVGNNTKTNQSVLKGPQGAPMEPRGHPKTSEGVPENVRDPKDVPRRSQGQHPRTPEDAPRHLQSSPRTAQGPPKTPKDSKRIPKDPNGTCKDLQRSHKSPKFIEKLFNELSNLRNRSKAPCVSQQKSPFQNNL